MTNGTLAETDIPQEDTLVTSAVALARAKPAVVDRPERTVVVMARLAGTAKAGLLVAVALRPRKEAAIDPTLSATRI